MYRNARQFMDKRPYVWDIGWVLCAWGVLDMCLSMLYNNINVITTRQSEMADLARRATRWVGTFPYILTPIPNLYDHSFPRYGQITFLTFRRPTTLTFDLKF